MGTISKAGVNLIKHFEGFLQYGTDEGDGTITIGYGTTKYDESLLGISVYVGRKTTKEEASQWLATSMTKRYLPDVMKYNNIYKFSQNEIDALTSFCYNAGGGSLSSLLQKGKASRQTIINNWPNMTVRPGSIYENGLRRRRKYEVALFKGDFNSDLTSIGVTKKNVGIPGISGGTVGVISSTSGGSIISSGKPAYNFKTYNLTEHEIQQLAFVATREQGGDVDGGRAELSLIANLYEERGSSYGSITNYVLKGGWFASNSTGNIETSKKWKDIVVDVLVKGHRTLPPQVNEHDWKGDLLNISTGSLYKNSDYKQLVTEVYQNPDRFGGSAGHWTFYCFPQNNKNKESDPFGTTKPKALKEWLEKYAVSGQFYWNSDTAHFAVGESPFTGGGSGLIAHVEKLYSSQNYEYIEKVRETENAFVKNLKQDFIPYIKNIIKQQKENKDPKPLVSKLKDYTLNFVKINQLLEPVSNKVSTRVTGTPSTSVLPVIKTLVEAPFFKVDINGVVFGVQKTNQSPNYVRSLTVNKVNGSLNEYNIQLVHQIRPGDNPNYIDEIISSVKYDVIKITYGNANTGQIFRDNKALITDVSQHFNFTNCNITYNINAVSIAATVASKKHDYPAYSGKVSTKIFEMLWEDKSGALLKLFPGMKDKTSVIKEGLIPTDDKEITISAVKNVSVLGYLNLLINKMESSSNASNSELNDSIYMISISDDSNGSKFKINKVSNIKSSIKNVPFMYEVNIGYPDENFVLDFDVNTDFAWALAYNGSKKVVKYDYDIDQFGEIQAKKVPSYYKDEIDEVGNRNLWTSLTRYPVDATLTIRGLTQASLLMQYIKINSYMYGAKRITSGVYIVTGQQDNIGNGVYSTTLQLMRVTGDGEYITIDGRKRT